MNTKTKLAQYAAAEEAATQARESLLKRLDANAEVIRNIWHKKFREHLLPDMFAWTTVYRKPGAVIRMTEDEQFPVIIEHEKKTYRIPASLFYGSNWDIAKVTRQIFYFQRYQDWSSDLKKAKIRVTDADRTLKGKVDKIERRAQREIEQLQRTHERSLEKDTQLLELRERQVKNLKKRFSSAS